MPDLSVFNREQTPITVTECQREKISELVSELAKHPAKSTTYTIESDTEHGFEIVLRFFLDGSAILSQKGYDVLLIFDSLDDLNNHLSLPLSTDEVPTAIDEETHGSSTAKRVGCEFLEEYPPAGYLTRLKCQESSDQ